MNAQKRHWCFTAYAGHLGLDDDFSGEEIIDAMRSHWESVNDLPGIRYAIAQIEKCPTSQRLHIQGYLESPLLVVKHLFLVVCFIVD